ncbi:DNA repair helicase RAD25 [Mycoemilia scoparia]|uniref:DNA 3'-5' helicase n=1 Tax=Mycoemilia scoparia TaxID=417184 RepID=A0A9W8DN49_9FUNG|nr:DNA repair helicase RAD25 [Mycoemilia scoparia]
MPKHDYADSNEHRSGKIARTSAASSPGTTYRNSRSMPYERPPSRTTVAATGSSGIVSRDSPYHQRPGRTNGSGGASVVRKYGGSSGPGSVSSEPSGVRKIGGSNGTETPVTPSEGSGDGVIVRNGDDSGQQTQDVSEDEDYDASINATEEFNKEKDLVPKAAFRKFGAGSVDEYSKERGDFSVQKDAISRLFKNQDYTNLLLKKDHASRPIWICSDTGHIILEAFSPIAELAIDFLIAISEPVSRPAHIHEYKLTPYSLYAAVSVGLETKDILSVLDRLSKVPLPDEIIKAVKECTVSYGKVKLVLKQNHYYVESTHADILQRLLRDPTIAKARVADSENQDGNGQFGFLSSRGPEVGDLSISGRGPNAAGNNQNGEDGDALGSGNANDIDQVLPLGNDGISMDDIDDGENEDVVHSFEIDRAEVENVKKQCNVLDYPMLEEYDFRNDTRNANLDIDLKPITSIRPYQEKSLSKMFGNGRARSGIIVLPCGAGKTLVGITAACTVKKSVLCLCTSSVSALQWRQQFLQWSTVKPHQIALFTSNTKEQFEGEAGIVISTYSMVAKTGKRSYQTQKMMDFLQSREWGFLLLDEVHVVPAAMFRRVVVAIAAHVKLGLTATLVREDDKIGDLNFLIGPKLYEANWMDLSRQGHIATVQCAEVWCKMTPEFYEGYLEESSRKKQYYYGVNPNKMRACKFLVDYHEKRGDKIIIFSDNLFTLKTYMRKLNIPGIYGDVSQQERVAILSQFRRENGVRTIILSTVGDTSLDLPEATCLIQISSHYGSRRQEAQRLGRILRAKRRNDEGFNAFFYSLVSCDTEEMFYSSKRQQFLIDQGYSFKTITSLEGLEEQNLYPTPGEEEANLLLTVKTQCAKGGDDDIDVAGYDDDDITARSRMKAKRNKAALSSVSGSNGIAYSEFRGQNVQSIKQRFGGGGSSAAKNKERHPLFQQRYGK